MEVGSGDRDVAQAEHPEYPAVPRDPGNVVPPEIDARLLGVLARKDPELLEHVAADVDSLVTRDAPVCLEMLVAAPLRLGQHRALAAKVAIEARVRSGQRSLEG